MRHYPLLKPHPKYGIGYPNRLVESLKPTLGGSIGILFLHFFAIFSDMSSISIPSRERDPFHGASGALLGHRKGGERLGPGGGQRKPPSAAGGSSRLGPNGVAAMVKSWGTSRKSVGFYCWNIWVFIVGTWWISGLLIAYFQASFPRTFHCLWWAMRQNTGLYWWISPGILWIKGTGASTISWKTHGLSTGTVC